MHFKKEKYIKVDNKNIGGDYPTFIIGEVGINHNGNIDLAKKLIDAAVHAKVDAVKFQTFFTEELLLRETPKAKYQIKQKAKDESLYKMIKKYELTKNDVLTLHDYTLKKGLIFLSTPYDVPSVHLLEEINVPLYKVSSGDLDNFLLLNEITKTKKPIIISTGMAYLAEIKETINFLQEKQVRDLIIMQCTTNYPSKFSELNLNVISAFKKGFPEHIIGFSDHSPRSIASIGAVSLGAKVIEKHFTLDKNLEGPDHKASLNPEELINLVVSIRKIEEAMGSYEKFPNDTENEIAKVGKKSIVLTKNLNKNEVLSADNMTVKRPAGGIPPSFFYKIIGKSLNTDKKKNSILFWDDIDEK